MEIITTENTVEIPTDLLLMLDDYEERMKKLILQKLYRNKQKTEYFKSAGREALRQAQKKYYQKNKEKKQKFYRERYQTQIKPFRVVLRKPKIIKPKIIKPKKVKIIKPKKVKIQQNLTRVNKMNYDENEVINVWKSVGFPGIVKLQKILREKNIHIKYKNLIEIINKQKTAQIHKTFKKKQKIIGHIISYAKNNKWQLDLSDMSAYSSKNRGYKYILLAIDIFSRKAFAEPLKTKSESDVTTAFIKMTKREKPESIMSDKGSEFISTEFKKLADDKYINLQTTEVGDHNALGIIDTLTRTLKNMTFKHFTESKSTNWIDNLQKMIDIYNNNPHSGLSDIKPNDVENNDQRIYDLNVDKALEMNNLKYDIKTGDKVRIRLKSFMRKGYEPKWSEDIYTVIQKFNVSVILNDGKRKKIVDIQKVDPNEPQPTPEPKTNETVSEVKKYHKKEMNFKKSGLDKNDILETKRVKKIPKNKIGIHE